MKVSFLFAPLLFSMAAQGQPPADYLAARLAKGKEISSLKPDFYNDLFTPLDGSFVLETLASPDQTEPRYVCGGFLTTEKSVPVALSAPGFSESFALSEIDKQGRRIYGTNNDRENPAHLAPLFGRTFSIRWETVKPLSLEVHAPQPLRVTAPVSMQDKEAVFRWEPDPANKNGILLFLRNAQTHKKYWLLTPDDGSLKRSDLSKYVSSGDEFQITFRRLNYQIHEGDDGKRYRVLLQSTYDEYFRQP